MLTRIEVDGFKNLLGFSAEFGPFTCIAGPNAVGKSNLFDAIEFLSLLAEHPLDKAASLVRATPGAYESARSLFWTDGQVWADRIRIAVELLVDGWVVDDLGRGQLPDSSRYRYEIELRFDGGLRLAGERLLSIASQGLHFPHHPSFAQAHRFDRPDEDVVVFDTAAGLMPDGSAAPDLRHAARTVLQLFQTVEHSALLAVGQELVSWRRFALNPADLRKPHEIGSATRLSPSGEHLPLLFMQLMRPGYPEIVLEESGEHEPAALSANIIGRLGRLAGLREVHVDEDLDRNLLTIRAIARSGEKLSARSLSEGSVRALALVLLGLTHGDRMVCIEEPENGIHPGQFEELTRILYDLSTDASADVSEELRELDPYETLPIRQAIVTTHSSDLVERIFTLHKQDLLMATSASVEGPQRHRATVLQVQPLRSTWRCRGDVRGVMLPMLAYVDYARLAGTESASAAEDS